MRNRMNICELCGHDSSEDGVLAHREQGDGERIKQLENAIRWALGEIDDFPERHHGDGPYWWRNELRRRAAGDVPYMLAAHPPVPAAEPPAQDEGAITVERAYEAAQRLINSHFHNDNRARCSIPADPRNDDDLVLMRFIEQVELAALAAKEPK
jgi:hypothetical protein